MIIAITDRKISFRSDFLEQVEAIAASSPDMIILREKDLSESLYRYLAIECISICCCHNVKFCVNSFVDTARALDTRCVQLSFNSFLELAGRLDDFEEVFVSVHSVNDAVRAEELGATHLIYGNVHETSCKPGVKGKGLDDLKNVCHSVNIPVLAIGGINIDNARSVIDAGCEGVCVRSLLMSSEDPSLVMRGLRKRLM